MRKSARLLSIGSLCLALAAGCGVRGLPGTAGEPGIQGPDGPTGPDGADGQLRVYGDGSAGELHLAENRILGHDLATDGNYQFTDVTIDAGVTLRVASGTVLRCTGTFTNYGTIWVSTGAGGGGTNFNGGNMPQSGVRPADAGLSNGAAGSGSVSVNGDYAYGGLGGRGLERYEAINIVNPGRLGGGGGGATGTSFGIEAGRGGGTLVVLAAGAILNAAGATVMADGTAGFGDGTGGGGGGIVVLASKTSVQQEGMLTAKGSGGMSQNQNVGAGGGGGGGIVHLIAPSLSGFGEVHVEGGAAGFTNTIGPSNRYFGGGGGGACGGSGGVGAGFDQGGMMIAPGMGSTGHFFETQTDPTALF